jgi:hypothetical protein
MSAQRSQISLLSLIFENSYLILSYRISFLVYLNLSGIKDFVVVIVVVVMSAQDSEKSARS